MQSCLPTVPWLGVLRRKKNIFCVKKHVAGGSPKRGPVIVCHQLCLCLLLGAVKPYEVAAGVVSGVYELMHVASYEFLRLQNEIHFAVMKILSEVTRNTNSMFQFRGMTQIK